MASPSDTFAACAAIAAALHGTPYAVVGGAACALLGSVRSTEDVDIVVPQGCVARARGLLARSPGIAVEPRTRHTHCVPPAVAAPVPIEILAPPTMFAYPFDRSTPTTPVQMPGQDTSVNVLHPLALLEVKLGAVARRSIEAKRRSDYEDIVFLLGWLRDNEVAITAQDVPSGTPELVRALIELYGRGEEWAAAGWPWA